MNKIEKIKQILKNNGIELGVSDRDAELQLDSITFLQVLVDIEDAFNVDLSNIENKNYKNNIIKVAEIEELIDVNE